MARLVDTTETSKSFLSIVKGNPVMLIVSKFFKTGDTLLGVRSVTLEGAVVICTVFELSILLLTLTVKVRVVDASVLNLLVKHLT